MAFSAQDFGPPIGASVGSFHAIHVNLVDFDKAALRLAALAAYIDEVELPLRAVKRIAAEDIRERFDTETSPDGHRWFALDPDYAARKQHDGFDGPILTREGELREKAGKLTNWVIEGGDLFFTTEDLPDYWRVHQEGSEDFGAVFHHTANPDISADTAEGTQNIPPRPFIGLSAEAEDKILVLFDIWFSEGLEMASTKFAVSSAGVLHERVKGRFGPRVDF